jgi:DNA-binding transcriptional LysR family regulator
MAKGIDWDRQIGRRLKLRDLHVFLTVAQRGSMAKAAVELEVAQPVVSAVIAGLEHAVGVRLFDRNSRGVQPTQYGRTLLEGGALAFEELKQAVKKIEFLADPSVGAVKIGCPETVAALLPPIIERMTRRHPHVVFHVTDAASPTFDVPQLRDRTLDLVVLRVRWPLPQSAIVDDLDIEELFDDETMVVAGMESRWARSRKIDLADLVNEEWILPPADTTNSIVVMEAFRARGLRPPTVSFVTYSVTLRTSLLATGRYLSVLPRSMMSLYGRRMALKGLPIKLAERKWPVVIATLKNRTLNPVAHVFIDHLRAGVKSLDVKALNR